jgi:uncharacterized membrane protein (UPF0127 family)
MNLSPARTPALLLLSMICCLAALGGCRQGASATTKATLPTVTMQIGNKPFTLEIANTFSTQQRGLMERDSMPADHGMIFVFEQERVLTFYMKNTRFPLDIIHINAAGTVVSIKQMKPYDLTTVPSDGPALWAIELNQGAAAAAGVKVGDRLDIPPAARSVR